MAILTLTRSNEYSYRLQKYKVFLDDKKIGSIANNETKDFAVSNGKHHLHITIDWILSSSTITFEVNDDKVEFFVGSSKYGKIKHPKSILLIAVFCLVALLIIKSIFKIDFPAFTVLIALIVLLYYVILARSRFLTINEVK